ncbi:MAG TPA: hypothetical protein VFL55_21445 [Acetobacteraceae bacterium]|nr:hypothetical protein [Acetobacteraceae bacterium]
MRRIALVVGCVGLLMAMLGWILEPAVFPFAWLAAVTFWIGWPLGCLALLLVHVLTGGRWGYAIRPYLLAGIGTLPLLVPAVVPILFVLPRLYPWLRADEAHELANRFYLNAPFAAGRACFYLGIWLGLAALVLRASRRGEPSAVLAAGGLILLGLTVTFAAVDATMSLDPHFVSSDYGMIAGAEAGLLALSVCVLVAALDGGHLPAVLDDLGKLLLGLLVLWAYLDFMQVLIVWQSDLPHEARWYVERSTRGWGILAGGIAVVHFLLPFFALISPRLRRSPEGIAFIAALLVVMVMLREWWVVLPAGHVSIGWVAIAAMLAVAGLSTALALRRGDSQSLRFRVDHA